MIEEKSIPGGVVHELPADLRKALELHPEALVTWQDITPLARNEWICWIESPKKRRQDGSASVGVAPASAKANGAHVVGPDAPTADILSMEVHPLSTHCEHPPSVGLRPIADIAARAPNTRRPRPQ
jgi:hypothetical protein